MKNIASIATKILAIALVAYTLIVVVSSVSSEPEEPEVVVEAKPVDSKQLQCLAENIYYEAGSESLTGQAAVAWVVINRVHHGFASTPCNVVYQTTLITKLNEETLDEYKVRMCQFSWVCEGKPKPNVNDPRYQRAKQVAYEVLAYDAYKDVLPRTALFFHNLTVDPLWPYKQVARIGNHIFYSKQKATRNEVKSI
jgi:spore germination cell wall hydrolase CwlJ-like protein